MFITINSLELCILHTEPKTTRVSEWYQLGVGKDWETTRTSLTTKITRKFDIPEVHQ